MGKSAIDFDSKFQIDTKAKTIVLVGKTGNGKSATGNSIIGADVFDSKPSFSGVTATCEMRRTVLRNGQILNVIDTPGLFDSSIDPESIGHEIAKCVNMAKNGIHAVLVVVSVRSRFSLEEASAIESLRQFFGSKIGDYMIVAFSNGDALGEMSLDDYIANDLPEPLAKTLKLCGNRAVLFDNVTNDEVKKSQQLKKLICLVDTVVDNNGGIPYTNELFVESPDNTSYNQEQLNRFLEKIESKLRETEQRLEKNLHVDRMVHMQAEMKAIEAQMKSNNDMSQLKLELVNNDMSQLKLELVRAQRDADELRNANRKTEEKLKEAEAKFKETKEKLKAKLKETEETKVYQK